ncbi:hypothetical protein TWF481_005730 [Arthrobotrys musiformis]|uniref:Uncharacterized protein n=1 Tax=Arthrobotrys musiformis TaxID=47236 RepID=A0AAV9WEJ2_9PEZI
MIDRISPPSPHPSQYRLQHLQPHRSIIVIIGIVSFISSSIGIPSTVVTLILLAESLRQHINTSTTSPHSSHTSTTHPSTPIHTHAQAHTRCCHSAPLHLSTSLHTSPLLSPSRKPPPSPPQPSTISPTISIPVPGHKAPYTKTTSSSAYSSCRTTT